MLPSSPHFPLYIRHGSQHTGHIQPECLLYHLHTPRPQSHQLACAKLDNSVTGPSRSSSPQPAAGHPDPLSPCPCTCTGMNKVRVNQEILQEWLPRCFAGARPVYDPHCDPAAKVACRNQVVAGQGPRCTCAAAPAPCAEAHPPPQPSSSDSLPMPPDHNVGRYRDTTAHDMQGMSNLTAHSIANPRHARSTS
jgi:hypothetical protein